MRLSDVVAWRKARVLDLVRRFVKGEPDLDGHPIREVALPEVLTSAYHDYEAAVDAARRQGREG